MNRSSHFATALSIAIGIAVSVFAFVSLGVLKRAAIALFTDVQKTAAELAANRL
jgi:hypothetical protein